MINKKDRGEGSKNSMEEVVKKIKVNENNSLSTQEGHNRLNQSHSNNNEG